MILRLWNGSTTPEHAPAYEQLLLDRIAPAIMERRVAGLHRLEVLRRLPQEADGSAVEMLTAMTFEDMAAVAAFVGGDPSGSVVPVEARALLARFDAHSRHYTTVARFDASGG